MAVNKAMGAMGCPVRDWERAGVTFSSVLPS